VGKATHAENAIKDYVDHIKSTALYSLEGLKIAVDCAHGSASATAPRLFRELGADVTILNAEPNGSNINENCGSTHLESLRKYVLENNMSVGVAFDGDADRCLCVDDLGNEIDGDIIMAICAKDMHDRGRLSRGTVVGTVLTNMGFIRFCEDNNLRFIATKVGDRYVLEEMLQEDYSFGGEQSGHMIFRDFATTGTAAHPVQLLSLLTAARQNCRPGAVMKNTRRP
jgi:phosphoglucosamine mutase